MKRTSSRIRAVLVAAFGLLVPNAHAASESASASTVAHSAMVGAASTIEESRAADLARPVAAIGDGLALSALAADPDGFPGRTYGRMPGADCLRQLEKRGVPYFRVGRTRGVELPMRITGPLHGVRLHADGVDFAVSARREVMDCRLVLALDDLAARVAARGVTEIVHYGIYRDAPLPAQGRPRHHVAGLAIDIAAFVKKDGTRLDVRRDFRGRIGTKTCTDADLPRGAPTPGTHELRGLLCDVVEARTFHQILTPNHDHRHVDHFHLEVMRNTSWTLVE